MKKIKYWVIYHEYYDYGLYMGAEEIVKSEDLEVIEYYLHNHISSNIKCYNNIYRITKEDSMNLNFDSCDDRYNYKYWIGSQEEIILEAIDVHDDMLREKVEGWLD